MSTYLSSLSGVPRAALHHFKTLPEQIVGRDALMRLGAYTALTAAVTSIALYYLRPDKGSFKKEHIQKDPISTKVFVHLDFVSQRNRFQISEVVKGHLSRGLIGYLLSGIFKSQKLWVPYLLNHIVLALALSILMPATFALLNPLYAYASAPPAPFSPEAVQIEYIQKLSNEGRVEDPQTDTSCAMVEFLAWLNQEGKNEHLSRISSFNMFPVIWLIFKKIRDILPKDDQQECSIKQQLREIRDGNHGEKLPKTLKEHLGAFIDTSNDAEINSKYQALHEYVVSCKEENLKIEYTVCTIIEFFNDLSKAVKAAFPDTDKGESEKAKLVKEYYRSYFYNTWSSFALEAAADGLDVSELSRKLLNKQPQA